MPDPNTQVVTGMRQPHHTGQVSKPMNEPMPTPIIRHQTLNDGEVEFNSINRRYRVEFERPKQQLDPTTGEIIQEGPRYLQFENYKCVTGNPTLIHQALGCKNIPDMNKHQHSAKCADDCAIFECRLGHLNPKNITQKYHPRHGSCGIKMDFWDAAEFAAVMKVAQKDRFIAEAKQIRDSIPASEMPEFLAAMGIEPPQLPQKSASK